jgi:hypothetical protein
MKMKILGIARSKAAGLALAGLIVAAGSALTDCGSKRYQECATQDGNVKDEALCVGRIGQDLVGADEDYFADMDYGVTKNPTAVAASLEPYVPGVSAQPEEAVKSVVRGRNNWIVWSAGNDRFWDYLSRESRGNLDFLKVLSNHPSLKYSRSNRWQYFGLVNEPCFNKPTGPGAKHYGLWLDERRGDCPPDPFENESKYPGVAIGARGKNVPVGSYYGAATGIVGLRLFPNPDFDEKAQARWDADKYYTDPSYYNDQGLVKPYRVGMSCGFCHVGPNPTHPPVDPENPTWADLNSNPGAQYFWVDRIFTYEADPTSFAYQLFHTSRPGGLDTSLVSSDYINNPRTMNAIYSLGARLKNALKFGRETLGAGSRDNAQLNDFLPPSSPLTRFFESPDKVWTPRVLKDGSDSVGALGALNRVYVNIGLFSEEWVRHFSPLAGGKKISPFTIEVARKNSSYWVANEHQTPDLALFFLASAKPDALRDAPGGASYLSADAAQVGHGKEVFAERCARCHSSKLPDKAYSFFPESCVGPNYLDCWNKYWEFTKTDEFKGAEREIVASEDFLKDNYLSTDLRVPVTLLETNACSPLATNAIAGNIWDNFSSDSYKKLPSVGTITVHDPITGEPRPYQMPGGGRGFTRPASLISLWSTAPYLLNNTVGDFYWTGTVPDRMKAFKSGIEQMLWPEKRAGNRKYETASGKALPGVIDVTTERSYLRVPTGYLPEVWQPLIAYKYRWMRPFFGEGGLEIGPIPKGTPITLVSGMDLDPANHIGLLPGLIKLTKALKSLPAGASDEEAIQVFKDRDIVNTLLQYNKCPDFVVNRGHYFGTDYFAQEPGLSDADKRGLIAFLETF